jgi:hypothetical protein
MTIRYHEAYTDERAIGVVEHVDCHNRAHADFGDHEYALDHDLATDSLGNRFEVWRWLCSCGARGQWQSQSDRAPHYAWLRHVGH